MVAFSLRLGHTLSRLNCFCCLFLPSSSIGASFGKAMVAYAGTTWPGSLWSTRTTPLTFSGSAAPSTSGKYGGSAHPAYSHANSISPLTFFSLRVAWEGRCQLCTTVSSYRVCDLCSLSVSIKFTTTTLTIPPKRAAAPTADAIESMSCVIPAKVRGRRGSQG